MARKHRGKVMIVSRHALLPLPQAPVQPLPIDAADVPFGTTLYLTRWFRELVDDAVREGATGAASSMGCGRSTSAVAELESRGACQFLQHVRPF